MNLFDRLPADLFRPLTGANQRQTWTLLVRLYERFFGPDAIPPQEEGFLQRDVSMEIERFLVEGVDWRDDDLGAETGERTPAVRANLILHRLIDTGWLREDLVGVRKFISMHPTITRFLETLHQFAVEGPQLIGGKVQMIYNQLRQVMEQPEAQAQGFQSAAQEAVRLIHTLNATAVRVRDVLASLAENNTTDAFVHKFFDDYVSSLFLRDYRDLRTDNHPLRHRWEIVSMVQLLRDDEVRRAALIRGYEKLPRGNNEDPSAAFEADVARFMKFIDIERCLDRLDHNVNEATRRAVSFLTYRLKTSDRLELLIEQVISVVLAADSRGLPIEGSLFPPGYTFSEERLRAPTVRAVLPPKVMVRQRVMTPRERALFLLRRAMVRHRDVTAAAVERYLERAMGGRLSVASDDLPIASVEDACVYLALGRLALLARATRGRRALPHPLLRRTTLHITFIPNERTENEFIEGPRFTVRRRG